MKVYESLLEKNNHLFDWKVMFGDKISLRKNNAIKII